MKTITEFILEKLNNNEEKLLNDYALQLIDELGFGSQDIEDEVDFYTECSDAADNEETIRMRFYKIVDLLAKEYNIGKFDASGRIKEEFNNLIATNIQ